MKKPAPLFERISAIILAVVHLRIRGRLLRHGDDHHRRRNILGHLHEGLVQLARQFQVGDWASHTATSVPCQRRGAGAMTIAVAVQG